MRLEGRLLLVAFLFAGTHASAQDPENPGPAVAPPPIEEILAKAYRQYGCEDSLIVCVDKAGNRIPTERLPIVGAGDLLIIRSIGANCDDAELKDKGIRVELSVEQVITHDRKLADEPSPRHPETGTVCTAPALLGESRFTVPDNSALVGLIVRFALVTGDGSIVRGSERPHRILIDQGRYFFEVGALLAFVPGGSRRIVRSPVPGSGEQTLDVETDARVAGALMLNIFPFGGRPRHTLFSPGGHSVGVQFGVDLDFSSLVDQFYGGLIYEPVSGAALSIGGALVRGEYLPEGSERGMLVPSAGAIEPVRATGCGFTWASRLRSISC